MHTFARGGVVAVAAALFSVLGACTSSPQGHLVVIGGGLTLENAGVWNSFVAHAGEKPSFVVVPTASQDRAGGIASNLPRIAKYAPTAPATGLPEPDAPAGSPTAVATIEGATALFFTGGDQSRVTKRFRPDGSDTPERRAMQDLLARGGVIAGTSAGAAMMSDPMFTGGGSETALGGQPERRQREPDDDSGPDENVGPRTGVGMGFFPFGMTDSHFFSRGRIGRLVAALELNKVMRGFGVADNRALDVDLSTGRMTALGEYSAAVVDISEMQRSGLSRRGVRVTLLSDGDVYDAASGRVTPGNGRKLGGAISGLPLVETRFPDAWGRNVAIDRMAKLASTGSPATSQSNTFLANYSADSRTRFSFDASGNLQTAVDVILDITERPATQSSASNRAAPAATAPESAAGR